MAESIAQNYFEKFTGNGAAQILLSLPNSQPKQQEDNWLDFKSGKPVSDDNLKEIWAKALGAMANVGGGVLVWGLIAKKHGKPEVDAVEKVELVDDVNAFASKLREFHHFVTDPPLPGVQIKAIPQQEGSKDGFVVCFIPEGPIKPYQTLVPRKAFYMRFGDSSKEPQVSILRALFHPQLRTEAEVKMKIRRYAGQGTEIYVLNLQVKNTGSTTIEYGKFAVTSTDVKIWNGPSLSSHDEFSSRSLDFFFHPAETTEFNLYLFPTPEATQYRQTYFPFVVTLYQRNCRAIEVEFAFHTDSLTLIKDSGGVKELSYVFVESLS